MRKYLVLAGVLAAFVIPAVSIAAVFDATKFGDLIAAGDKCANGAFYHFVNNQTATDAAPGLITVSFDGVAGAPFGPYAVNKHVQHFSAFSTGELTGASTNLDGKLVLSSVTCKKS